MSAIKPSAFLDFRDVVKKVEPEESELEESESVLADMANSAGWIELKKYINNLKQEIGNLNKSLMENGAEFEEIGRNAVVSQLALDLLDKIVVKVEDAREAITRRRK